LSFAYPDGTRALAELSLRIDPGERVGLVGPNGAGKTTLFLCLAGILRTPSGAVHVAGLDPWATEDRKKLPAKIGIVFQNSDDQLFHVTILDDVAFGPLNLGLPNEEIKQRVSDALSQTGLTGLETRVPFHLSGGEKRRAAVAGILAMRPEILLLDEPTVYLDPRGRREFIELVNRLAGTKLIAAHDLEMIRQTCDRVVLLDNGKLAADGPTDSILGRAELMAAHGLEVPFSLGGQESGKMPG
jgi:cobalt/nickel transport system ATP-binding protein